MPRLLDEILSPSSLAVLFFLAFSMMTALYIGKTQELKSCRHWSEEAWTRLGPTAKQELMDAWQSYQDETEARHEAGESAPRP